MRRAIALLAAVLVVSGCTDIPSSSGPDRIESVPAGAPASPPQPPPKNALPRQIVNLFLFANTYTDKGHAAARQFLTAQANRSWTDDTSVTVLGDYGVGDYNPTTQDVAVSGGVVGTVDANGIYTPSLLGVGTGGPDVSYQFKVKMVKGQYRIDKLPTGLGLLLGLADYSSIFRTYPLYFFDQGGHYLVPDLRASALTGRALQNWLLLHLAAGPRPSLVTAVDNETFPGRPSRSSIPAAQVAITRGPPLDVEVPGAAGLDDEARRRLGAQIARTLESAAPPDTIMSITDDHTAVAIKVTGGSQFAPDQFGLVDRPAPPGEVYYLREGRVVSAAGRVVPGRLATGPLLDTLAVARRGAGNVLQVAGAVDGQLYVGTSTAGLTASGLDGLTSRPAWAPGLGEVWVGAGARLYRVAATGGPQVVDVAAIARGEGIGQILAVRLSPEGARVALVVRVAGTDSQQLWVGSVSRERNTVRVSSLEVVSPQGVGITDVGWIGPTRLFSIGYRSEPLSSQIFEENVDGSDWKPRGIANLPGGPDFATVVPGHVAWVSAQDSVWLQSSNPDWDSPGPGSPTPGDAPAYLE